MQECHLRRTDSNSSRIVSLTSILLLLAVVATTLLVHQPAQAALLEEDQFSLTGFFRERVSMNLQDLPDTRQDDKHDLSMVRHTFQLEPTIEVSRDVSFSGVFRWDVESMTNYLERLENPADLTNPFAGATAGSTNLTDYYSSDEQVVRELYTDLQLTSNMSLRLGKQQVAWGETDFFQAMDVVHGFDLTWRFVLEGGNNERIRKPLTMANLRYQLPDWNGSLQLLYIPGYDDPEEFGTDLPTRGGRFAPQGLKGLDLFALVPQGFNHPSGQPGEDENYGIRWIGQTSIMDYYVDYTLAYLHTFNKTPIINAPWAPYKGVFTSAGPVLGEQIFPEIDLVGATFNTYVPATGGVVRGEASFTFDKPFNRGTHQGLQNCPNTPGVFAPGDANPAPTAPAEAAPGFCGVREKDSVKLMLGFDRQVTFTQWMLGADRPSLLSLQLFDQWIPSLDRSDDINQLFGAPSPQDEHSVTATALLQWNYWHDFLNPQIAIAHDLSYGGGFVIPAVNITYGNNWRFKVEGDFFYEEGSNQPAPLPFTSSDETHLMGFEDNNNQLYAEVTYQF